MRYRLLALDMDGTLLTSRKLISAATRDALARCVRAGVTVALCTGRAPSELRDYQDDIAGIVRFGVVLSGGVVYDLAQEKPLSIEALPTDVVLAVLEEGLRAGAMPCLLTPYTTVARPTHIARMSTFHMGVYQPMYERLCTPVDDLASYARTHEGEIVKVNLYHTSTELRNRTRARLAQLPAQLADAETTSLEFSAQGVTKARGLKLLCQHVGCTLEECVAVGDAPNDADVLAVAGLPVAMGNATPDIKACAQVVVADNDHDGIVEVVDRMLWP